jgi:hypothetical protein
MATGDIIGVTIRADGWSADVTIDEIASVTTYDYGLGTNNDTTNAKMVFTLTSLGYDSAGDATTVERTVYGMYTIRKPYPDQATLDETVVDTTDLKIRVALSDFVFDPDVTVVANVAANWADTSKALVDGAVTNSSTLAYPSAIANWAWPDRQRIEGDFKLRAVGIHQSALDGKMLAAMKFTIDDGVNPAIVKTVSTATVDTTMGDLNAVIEYVAEFSAAELGTLNDGNVSCDFQAIPLVGDAGAILDTSTSAYIEADWKYRTHSNLLDIDGNYGKTFAVVDVVSGNDTTGLAAATLSGANSTPYATIYKAVRGVRDFNNSTYSRDNAASGYVHLKAGTHESAGGAVFTPVNGEILSWLEILPYTGESKSTITITPSSASGDRLIGTSYVKFTDLTFTRSTNAYWAKCAPNGTIWFDDCVVDSTGTAYEFYVFNEDLKYMTNSTFITPTTKVTTPKVSCGLVRGTTVTGVGGAGNMTTILGCNFTNGVDESDSNVEESVTALEGAFGAIMAFNKFYDQRGRVVVMGNSQNTAGLAIVQNIIERTDLGAGNYTAMTVYGLETGDETDKNLQNMIFINNTIIGQRCNLGYNASGTGNLDYVPWCEKNNVFRYRAWKGDTFDAPVSGASGNRVGNWSAWYGTCFKSNITDVDDAFGIETNGVNCFEAETATLAFTDDKSGDTGAGTGDYHLGSGSVALGLTLEQMLPYDLDGVARELTGAVGAYEFVASSGDDRTRGQRRRARYN